MNKAQLLLSRLQGKTTRKFIYKKSVNNEILKFSIEDITIADMKAFEGYNVTIDGDEKYPHLISVTI